MVFLVLGAVIAVVLNTCMSSAYLKWQRTKYGPLQLAANDGDVEKIEQLLHDGIDINGRCEFRSWTALHAAAERGQVAAAKVLLEHGAKPDLKDPDGRTPLHVAGYQGKGTSKATEPGRNAVAVLLLDHGADPNATTQHGDNALHCAVMGRDATLVRILLERGADPSFRNADGYTPVELAGFRKDEALVSAFRASRPAAEKVP
jgi:ankyrin repeat protein